MANIDKALRDPSSVYAEPKNVVDDDTISREDKIKILRQWEYDARELQVAEEENMPARDDDKGSMLSRVKKALHELGFFAEEWSGGSSKQGGD